MMSIKDRINNIEYELAFNKAKQGKDTGAVSRILSGIQLLLFVFLLVNLIKYKQYFASIIILALGFTPFSTLGFLGLLIYLFLSKLWIGLILLLLSGSFGWLSAWFGIRNAKRLLHAEKAKIDPFDGMTDLFLWYILVILFTIVASFTSGVLSVFFWILFSLVILFIASRYYYRLSSPWRRLHFSLMSHYAQIIGYHQALMRKSGKKFNINNALSDLLQVAYPTMTDDESLLIIDSAKHKIQNFSDRDKLEELIKERNPRLRKNELDVTLDNIGNKFKVSNEAGLLLRFVISEIISRDLGEAERINYILAVITGKAT